jgi:hypothetical protein
MSASNMSPRTVAAERTSLASVLGERNIWLLFALGFATGYPFHAWLNTFARVDLAIDGALFLSMIGFSITSLIAVLTAPLLDRFAFPGFARIGHRKSWVAAALIAAVALLALYIGTKLSSEGAALRFAGISGAAAMIVHAFLWIAMDALRIDLYRGRSQAVAATATYLGGLTALVLLSRFALPGDTVEMAAAYATLLAIGIGAVVLVREPPAVADADAANAVPYLGAWRSFMARNGLPGVYLLAAIACYALAASVADFLGAQGYLVDLLRTDFRDYDTSTSDAEAVLNTQTVTLTAIGIVAGLLIAFGMAPARAFAFVLLSILALLIFFVACKIALGFTVFTVAGLFVLRTLIWSGAFIVYLTIAARLTAPPHTAGHVAIITVFGSVFWISEQGLRALAMPYGSYLLAAIGSAAAIAALVLIRIAARVARPASAAG